MKNLKNTLFLSLFLVTRIAQAEPTALLEGQQVYGDCTGYPPPYSYTVPDGNIVEYENISYLKLSYETSEAMYPDGYAYFNIMDGNSPIMVIGSDVSIISHNTLRYDVTCYGSPGRYVIRTYKPAGVGLLKIATSPRLVNVYVKIFDAQHRLSGYGTTDSNGVLELQLAYGKYTAVATSMDQKIGIMWYNQSPRKKASSIIIKDPISTPKAIKFTLSGILPVIDHIQFVTTATGNLMKIEGINFGKKKGLVDIGGDVYGKVTSWSDTLIIVDMAGQASFSVCPRIWNKTSGWSMGYSDPANCAN